MGNLFKKRNILRVIKKPKYLYLQEIVCLLINFILYNNNFSFDNYNIGLLNTNFINIEFKKLLSDSWNIDIGLNYYLNLINDIKFHNRVSVNYANIGKIEIVECEGASYRDSTYGDLYNNGFSFLIGIMYKNFLLDAYYSIKNNVFEYKNISIYNLKNSFGGEFHWENDYLGCNLNSYYEDYFYLLVFFWVNFYLDRMNLKSIIGYQYNGDNILCIGLKFLTYYRDLALELLFKYSVNNVVYDMFFITIEKKYNNIFFKFYACPSIIGNNLFSFSIGFILF